MYSKYKDYLEQPQRELKTWKAALYIRLSKDDGKKTESESVTSQREILKEYLKKAAQQDALIVFFSHDIYPTAQGVHMKTAWLEELLKYARELNMRIIGAEELQKLRK